MTDRHDDPDHVHDHDDAEFEAFLRREGELSSLLRGVPQPEVPEHVDAVVRADARAALQQPAGAANDAAADDVAHAPGGTQRRVGPGLREYRVPLALAATVVLGVSLGVQWKGWQGEPAPWRVAEHTDTSAAPAPAAAPAAVGVPASPGAAPPAGAAADVPAAAPALEAGLPAQLAVPAPKPGASQAADVLAQANRAEAEQEKREAQAAMERAAAAKERTQGEPARRAAAKLAGRAAAAAPAPATAAEAPAPAAVPAPAQAPAVPAHSRVAIPVPAPFPAPLPAPAPAVVAKATSLPPSPDAVAPHFAPAPPPPPPYLPPAAEAQVLAPQSAVLARSRPVQVTGHRSALPTPASDARAEQWLALITELLDQHLDADARQAWHEFRAEYPAYRVTADLQARIDALPPADQPR